MLHFGWWLFLGVLLLAAFTLLLWWRTTRRSRFQARLTLLFLLFILIPVISLTLLMSYLLLQSNRLLEQPGISGALQQSLQAVYAQLDQMGETLLRQHPALAEKRAHDLHRLGVHHAGTFSHGPSTIQWLSWGSQDGLVPRLALMTGELDAQERQGVWVPGSDPPLYEYYQKSGDGPTRVVAMVVPPALVQARQALENALNSHATFALLRETVIDQGLMGLVALLLLIVLSLVAVFFARQFSDEIGEPVRALAESMQAVGRGDLEARVTARAKDEVAVLIDSFHHMADDLRNSREKLLRAERAAAWRDAARQVSHEIKNPLTPIQLSLHRLKSQLSTRQARNKDIREALRIIEEEVASIRRIAGTFSEFARMPAMELQPTAPETVLQQAIQLIRAEYPRAQLQLRVDQEVPLLALDREQLRRALHNLLKNGIEACGANQALEISLAHEEEQGVRFTIRDHGCGMAEETLQRLQQPYFTTKKEGSGLGLTIARRIILEHGGSLEMESKVDEGTTVTIRLRS